MTIQFMIFVHADQIATLIENNRRTSGYGIGVVHERFSGPGAPRQCKPVSPVQSALCQPATRPGDNVQD